MRRDTRSCYRSAVPLLAAAMLFACGGDEDTPAPTVELLSSKPEYVSGGDALIAVQGAGTLSATLNGTDISVAFKTDPNDATRRIGLVSGLANGANTFVASVGGVGTSLSLTNYPITGPMLSGPLLVPYICQTDAFTLPDGTKPRAAPKVARSPPIACPACSTASSSPVPSRTRCRSHSRALTAIS
jgi:hypothetical protein